MSKRSTTSIRLAAAIVLFLVLAGCTAKPSLMPGTYTTSITREDVSSYLFIAEWALTFSEENGYSLTKDGQLHEEGSYTLTQDQIEFASAPGTSICSATGTYQWASDEKELTLTKICPYLPGSFELPGRCPRTHAVPKSE